MRGLLERDDELRALDDLVAFVRGGGSRALLLEGVAGIGKSSLLAEAVRRGRDAGLTVRSGRGGELERDLPYGVALQLLEADAGRDEVLRGSARLAGGLLHVAGAAESLSDHATTHGLYSLLANMAEQDPVLLVVDDVHWADAESVRWLTYVLRRLDGLAVGVLLGARAELTRTWEGEVLHGDPALATLRPSPLSSRATGVTIGAELGPVADEAVVAACWTATGGNPLLLRELVRSLQQLPSGRPDAADVARIAPEGVASSVRRRLAALGPEATRLAEAAAVLGPTSIERAAAVAGVDLDAATPLAAALARAGLMAATGMLEFEHPVVRTTVYDQVPPVARAQLHARAAHALLARGVDVGQVAPHIVASPVDARVRLLPELLAASADAARRGAPDAAVRWLTVAATDAPPARRAEVMLQLGLLEGRLGRPEAVEHLRAASRETTDLRTRAAAAMELVELLTLGGDPGPVREVLTGDLVREVREVDPELALRLRAALAPTVFLSPLEGETASRQLLADLSEPRGRSSAERDVLAALALLAPTAAETSRLGRLAVGDGRLGLDDLPRPALLQFLMLKLSVCDELDLVDGLLDQALARARGEASLLDMTRFTFMRGVVAVRRGDFARSVTELSFVLETLEEQGVRWWPVGQDSTLYRLTASLANRGRVAEARQAVARWRTRSGGLDGGALMLAVQLVRLDAAEGRLAEALEHVRPLVDLALAMPLFDAQFTGILTLAAPLLSAAGDHEAATVAATSAYDAAVAWGVARGIGTALVARGLTREGDARIADLAEACRVLDSPMTPFERAGALVELGAAIRRSGRRAEARAPLQEALELAHACGADGLVARANQELGASGARPRRMATRGVDALTPSELRVALLAADGHGNPEIAQALFVSRKTVEKHLGNAFAKLHVAGRGQLAAALREARPDP